MRIKDNRWGAVAVSLPTQRLGAAGLTPGKPVILPAVSPRRRWIGDGGRVARGMVSLRSLLRPQAIVPARYAVRHSARIGRGDAAPARSRRVAFVVPRLGSGSLFFAGL